MKKRSIFTLFALALSLAVPSLGHAAVSPTPLFDDAFSSGGWVGYRVTAPAGAQIGFDIKGTVGRDQRRLVTGSYLLSADGSPRASVVITQSDGARTEQHIQGPDPIGVVVSENQGYDFGPERTGGMSATWTIALGGEFVFLSTAVSDDMITSRFKMFASDGVEISRITRGARTFAYTESDMRGTANVSAWGGPQCHPYVLFVTCSGAKAMIDQAVEISVSGRMFGQFSTGPVEPAIVRTFQTPTRSGTEVGAGSIPFVSEPAGTYLFRVIVDAGTYLSGLTVWGADVTLP